MPSYSVEEERQAQPRCRTDGQRLKLSRLNYTSVVKHALTRLLVGAAHCESVSLRVELAETAALLAGQA